MEKHKNVNDVANKTDLIIRLNSSNAAERLEALQALKTEIDDRHTGLPQTGADVNNHIHTTYSFSPYTPSMAVLRAWESGLCTAGIMDHDSVSGVREFIDAGSILDFPVTVGAEVRATHISTAIGSRHTNNPDQIGVSYLSLHGIPHSRIDIVAEFFSPIGISRGRRNRQMCEDIATITGLQLDYEHDVLPFSMAHEGGSVTERHLLYVLALNMIGTYGKGEALTCRIGKFMELSAKEKDTLSDTNDQYYVYRLLGIFKATLVERLYKPADVNECPDIRDVVRFADENGIILTYPYLGDVSESPTGDKKAQRFEDSYLDELLATLNELGLKAVSFMPSRNTKTQISRLRALCDSYGMLQITGEDINTPFQSFICSAQRDPYFSGLYDSTWALIGHERAASKNLADGFLRVDMPLQEKIEHFKRIGQSI
jgi:hypothetical protein